MMGLEKIKNKLHDYSVALRVMAINSHDAANYGTEDMLRGMSSTLNDISNEIDNYEIVDDAKEGSTNDS